MKTSASILAFLLITSSSLTLQASAAEGQPFRDLQRQIDVIKAEVRQLREDIQSTQLQLTFRELEGRREVAPGADVPIALACEVGEVVISGGYAFEPAGTLVVKLNGPSFDGSRSGWTTVLTNPTATTVGAEFRLSASCSRGVGRSP
jgi:hypothetical protein